MEFETTNIAGLLVIRPRIFEDDRGYFFESFRADLLGDAGFNDEFIQDNESKSQKGVLRGLHFQERPKAQAKLIRVVSGGILDVAVDIRSSSETYGQHFSIELNQVNKVMLLIPEGFAHGFLTLEDNTIMNYKCSDTYSKDDERTINWNDPDIGINWGATDPILSEKDKEGVAFSTLSTSF